MNGLTDSQSLVPQSDRLFTSSAASDEEAAAFAAIGAYLAQSDRSSDDHQADRGLWALAGRLESHGLPVTRQRLERGWRG